MPPSRYSKKYSRKRIPLSKLPRSVIPEMKFQDLAYAPFPIGLGDMRNSAGVAQSFNASMLWSNTNTDPWTAYQLTIVNSNSNVGGVYLPSLNDPQQGTGQSARIGDEIYMKSLWIQLSLRTPQPASLNSDPVTWRMLVVLDRQPNGTVDPAAAQNLISQVLSPITTNGTATGATPLSHHNLDNRRRFKTLCEIKDAISPNGAMVHTYERWIDLNFTTVYTQATNLPFTNAIHIILVSDGGVFTNASGTIDTRPYVWINTRLRYTDA